MVTGLFSPSLWAYIISQHHFAFSFPSLHLPLPAVLSLSISSCVPAAVLFLFLAVSVQTVLAFFLPQTFLVHLSILSVHRHWGMMGAMIYLGQCMPVTIPKAGIF